MSKIQSCSSKQTEVHLGRTNYMFMRVLSHFKEGKIFILVDLYCKDRVSRGLSKTTQTHLGIEEVHHGLLHRREGGKLTVNNIN